MAKSFVVDTASTVPLLTTAEAKSHLKITVTTDDTLIDNLIKAARESAEVFTNRFFIQTVLSQYGDNFTDLYYLFKSPLIGVDKIQYYDIDDSLQVLSTDVYITDLIHQPARIGLKPNQSFPNLADRLNAVICIYKVGYGTAASDVPEAIRQAVLLTVGNWYENRQNVVVGHSVNELPKSAQYLLEQYKVQTV
tara:strand:+ start:72 stop:650 length:579 start_codon:yes stop_codon:yes gene_type:complete